MSFEQHLKNSGVLYAPPELVLPPNWHDEAMLASLREDISKWLSEKPFGPSTSKMERARLRAAQRKGKQDDRSC